MDRRKWTRMIAAVLVGLASSGIYWFGHPQSGSLISSVLAGVLASAAFEIACQVIDFVDYWFNRRVLIATFGPDVLGDGFTLAYASFRMSSQAQAALQAANEPMPHLATDDNPAHPAAVFRVDEPVAAHDLRALTYLATRLTQNGAKPLIRRAADIVQPFDLSFVAFGLGGSQKARQLLEQLEPFDIRAAGTSKGGWIDLHRISTNTVLAQPQSGQVVGYVIRLHRVQFPARTWFLCAGPGPDGTVASAFYLSRRFDHINKLLTSDGNRLGPRPCVIVLRAKPGLEESAIVDTVIPLQ